MQSEPCSVDVRYIPLRKQKVLTRPSYIDLQMGLGLSIAGRERVGGLDVISFV